MSHTFTANRVKNRANVAVKRAFDIFFASLVALLVLSWLIPLIGVLIKLDS